MAPPPMSRLPSGNTQAMGMSTMSMSKRQFATQVSTSNKVSGGSLGSSHWHGHALGTRRIVQHSVVE